MSLVLISAGCNSSVQRASSDTEEPVVTLFSLTSGTPTTDQVIDFIIGAADNKGVAAYLINEDATPPLFTDPGWQASKPAIFTVSAGFGPKTVYAWVKDSSNNVSDPAAINVTIAWDRYQWSWRIPITVPSSALAEDLTDFPVYITAGRFGDIRQRPDEHHLAEVEGRVKGILRHHRVLLLGDLKLQVGFFSCNNTPTRLSC